MQHTFYISRVVFGPDGFGEITNGSDQAADPAGLQLCQFPSYPNVPAGIIEPGGTARVPAAELGGLNSDAGELALYVEPSFEDPNAVVAYVQWGSVGHKREEPAIGGGVWSENAFVDAATATEIHAGPLAVSASDWTVT